MYKGSNKFGVFFPTEFLALFTPEKQARNLNSEEGGQGVGGVYISISIYLYIYLRRKFHDIKC